MAFNKIPESFVYSAIAGENLSAKLNYLGNIRTDGTITLADAGEIGFPIVEAAASGSPITIQIGGIGKATAGGSFNAGVDLAADSSGKLVAAGSGVAVVGHSLEVSGGDSEVVSYIIAVAPSP